MNRIIQLSCEDPLFEALEAASHATSKSVNVLAIEALEAAYGKHREAAKAARDAQPLDQLAWRNN